MDLDENNIIYVKANSKKGFNFGYLLNVPESVTNNTLIAEINNTGFVTDDEKIIYKEAYKSIYRSRSSLMFKDEGLIHMMPLFPRITNLYTHALSRDTLLTDRVDIRRIDLQFIAMINDAKKQLEEIGFTLDEKFILNGFSASGAFSNRFAVMHPELLKGVISGGQTYAIIPKKSINGIELTYPIGINDLEEIFGIKFNSEAYFDLPQFIYEGDQNDANDTTKYLECMQEEQAQMIYKLFGDKPKSKRLEKQIKLFKELNYKNIDMKLYEGEGHSPQIEDMKDFINKCLKSKNKRF